MIVGRGAMTFRAFAVGGKNASPSIARVVERLEQFAFSGLGADEEGSCAGWIGPEHLFDGDFAEDRVHRGAYATFSLRVDTRKVNGALLAAHAAVEIQATLEAEGLERLSGARKRELKQVIKRRLLKELPPSQRAYGVFWNLRARKVYLQSTSKTVAEHFRGLFERTFELELIPQVPGLLAADHARDEKKAMNALQDARPTRLTAARPRQATPAGAAPARATA